MPADPPASLIARLRAAGCVFAEEEAALLFETADSSADLERLIELRVSGLPLEHVLGWVQFAGRRFTISPGVFVPRRRTELLARTAIANLPRKAPVTVVELCCGCGAIGATIACEVAAARVYAADIDPVAVRCAHVNLRPLGGVVFQGDLYQPLPQSLRGTVDLVVANAPYVPTERIELMPPEARDHEPHIALDGGKDGLDILRRVLFEAEPWLSAEGILLVEASPGQAAELQAVAQSLGRSGELVSDEEIDGSALLIRRMQR